MSPKSLNFVCKLLLGRKSVLGISNRRVNWQGQCWQHPWRVFGLWDAYGAPNDRSHHLSASSRPLPALRQQPAADRKMSRRWAPNQGFPSILKIHEKSWFGPKNKSGRVASGLILCRPGMRGDKRYVGREVIRAVAGGAVGVPESRNTSGMLPALSLSVYTAIGDPKPIFGPTAIYKLDLGS